jgi:ATPase subunit of ABC transporter with duplicated ATPase domains
VAVVIRTRDLCIDAPGGRALFQDLQLSLEVGDRVALVGRNGVGKSTLLEVLAGELAPTRGLVTRYGQCRLVSQALPGTTSRSPGQCRRDALAAALEAEPDLLLLDEPTRDLDEVSVEWLSSRLKRFRGALVVVSHDRRVLSKFEDFFVAAESGARHYHGTWTEILAQLESERVAEEERYCRRLEQLSEREQHNDTLLRRRAQKKNLGRLHELRRCPARAKLNAKRGYAQVSQGRRAGLQAARIEEARSWVKTARRALAVNLPLQLQVPELPPESTTVIHLDLVSAHAGGRRLFEHVSLTLSRQRLAVLGPNGSGKSTLVELMSGRRFPQYGSARCDEQRIGYIAQNASNWQFELNLLQLLVQTSAADLDHAARVARAHRFPLGLATRALSTLSPGERVRAALIVLFERRPPPEMLILDEPTDALDLLGQASLERTLAAWPGGLVLVSHDPTLLSAVGVQSEIVLG